MRKAAVRDELRRFGTGPRESPFKPATGLGPWRLQNRVSEGQDNSPEMDCIRYSDVPKVNR